MSTPYDPYSHAQDLGLVVIYAPLCDRWGEYHHGKRTVVLHRGLTAAQERCTLAHEVAHAEYGDVVTGRQWWDARSEARADRVAAGRLVDPGDLKGLVAVYGEDFDRLALELGVTRWLLDAALRGQRQ